MTAKIDTMTFEQSMQELETLVRRLEEGRMPLEESIKAYERGMALKNHCQSKLQEAKLKVDQIVLAPGGEVSLKPFDAEWERYLGVTAPFRKGGDYPHPKIIHQISKFALYIRADSRYISYIEIVAG